MNGITKEYVIDDVHSFVDTIKSTKEKLNGRYTDDGYDEWTGYLCGVYRQLRNEIRHVYRHDLVSLAWIKLIALDNLDNLKYIDFLIDDIYGRE